MFWKDFGRVQGGQKPRFSNFLQVFSKQILKRVSKSKKVDQNGDLDGESANLGWGAGGPEAPGDRLQRGVAEFYRSNYSNSNY